MQVYLAQAMRACLGLYEIGRRPSQLHKQHRVGRMQRYPCLRPA